MKYRGNFDVDACERQFEKRAQREAERLGGQAFDTWEEKQANPRKRFKGRKRERPRAPKFGQE